MQRKDSGLDWRPGAVWTGRGRYFYPGTRAHGSDTGPAGSLSAPGRLGQLRHGKWISADATGHRESEFVVGMQALGALPFQAPLRLAAAPGSCPGRGAERPRRRAGRAAPAHCLVWLGCHYQVPTDAPRGRMTRTGGGGCRLVPAPHDRAASSAQFTGRACPAEVRGPGPPPRAGRQLQSTQGPSLCGEARG